MARYLIKRTLTATEANVNHAGQVLVYITGKEGMNLFVSGNGVHDYDWMTPRQIGEHSYKRLCDVKRVLKNTYIDDPKFWKTELEILSFGMFEYEEPLT